MIPYPGSHCSVNRTNYLCAAVQYALLPLHTDSQRQQGILHSEREGRSRPCSKSSHDSEGLPLHVEAGKDSNETECWTNQISSADFQVLANVVCWSVIAMLKEYIFLTLAFSVLAVLAAIKLHEKCSASRNQNDLETNQEGDNQAARKSLAQESKDNEGLSEHKKARMSQVRRTEICRKDEQEESRAEGSAIEAETSTGR